MTVLLVYCLVHDWHRQQVSNISSVYSTVRGAYSSEVAASANTNHTEQNVSNYLCARMFLQELCFMPLTIIFPLLRVYQIQRCLHVALMQWRQQCYEACGVGHSASPGRRHQTQCTANHRHRNKCSQWRRIAERHEMATAKRQNMTTTRARLQWRLCVSARCGVV